MQKGFSVILLIIGLLIIFSGTFGGYYAYKYYQNQKITDFETCSKVYPVLLSYPGQCNTPDGKHFVQPLSDEEKKKLVPPQEITQDEKTKIDNWIKQNGLNEFGDKNNIEYLGGTPLYNEMTGESTDRYVYILRANPSRPWN